MRSIYKYDVVSAPNGIIEGPITKILTAQVQHNSIVVWAEVDTTAPNRKFQIIPIGTGWPLDAPNGKSCVLDTHTYISTVQIAEGNLIFHIYGAEIVSKPSHQENVEKTKKEEAKVKIDRNREATFTAVGAVINPDVLRQFIH